MSKGYNKNATSPKVLSKGEPLQLDKVCTKRTAHTASNVQSGNVFSPVSETIETQLLSSVPGNQPCTRGARQGNQARSGVPM